MIPQYKCGTACGVKTSDSGQYMGGSVMPAVPSGCFYSAESYQCMGELLRYSSGFSGKVVVLVFLWCSHRKGVGVVCW